MKAPNFFYRDDFYKYCSKALRSSEIQKSKFFPSSIKTSSNPSIIELGIHPRTNGFQVTSLLPHLRDKRHPLPKLFL